MNMLLSNSRGQSTRIEGVVDLLLLNRP